MYSQLPFTLAMKLVLKYYFPLMSLLQIILQIAIQKKALLIKLMVDCTLLLIVCHPNQHTARYHNSCTRFSGTLLVSSQITSHKSKFLSSVSTPTFQMQWPSSQFYSWLLLLTFYVFYTISQLVTGLSINCRVDLQFIQIVYIVIATWLPKSRYSHFLKFPNILNCKWIICMSWC